MKVILWLSLAALPLLAQKEVVNLSPSVVTDDHPQLLELLKIRRLYVEKLAGGETAVQIRDMLIGSLQASRLFIVTENPLFRDPRLVSVWLVAMAFLMISNVATLSWSKLRPRRAVRLEVIAFFGLVAAGLLQEPWWTLIGISAVYLATLPLGVVLYWRAKRQRGAVAAPPS